MKIAKLSMPLVILRAYFEKTGKALIFLILFSLISIQSYSAASGENFKGSEDKTFTIDEYEECLPMSAAINFVSGSLFVGSGRNTVWVRAAINEPGNFYVVLYSSDPGAITDAQIRTAAITAGAQNAPNGAVEIPGTSTVGVTSQQQQFTAASVPSFPSFTGTPYAGARFTALTFATTYHYRIVARDAAGANFSPIISGTITTANPSCTVSSPGSNQSGSSPNVCGPRTVQFNMSFTNIVYGDPYLMQFRFFFLYETNATGAPFTNVSPTLTNPTEMNRSLQVWTASQTNVYPDNGTICAYNARAYLAYSDLGLCPIFQDQTFEVFDDIGNTALGQIGISPPLPTGIEVCEGASATVNFTNSSVINCVAPRETEKKNTVQRWYQYVYGSNAADADFMDKVQVVVPPGTQNFPVGANPGGGAGSTITTFPYNGPIMFLASADETTPLPPSFNINVLNTNVFGPDNRFRVTLRMWNVCNPYDDALDVPFGSGGLSPTTGDNANGDVDPVTTFSEIILVQQPPDPTAVNKEICQGSALPTFEINYTGTSSAVRWYDDNAGVIGALVSTTGANTKTLAASTAGITPAPNSGTPGVYAVWAQYQRPTTGTVQCFSDPIRTTITVKESPLPTPAAFTTSSTQVCQGDTNVTFQLPATSGNQTIGGGTQYEWVATDNADVAVASTDVLITPQGDGRTALVNFPVPGSYATRIRKIRVRSIYSAGQTCPSGYRDVTVTVFGPSQGGSISPTSQTICDGAAITNISASGFRGTIQGWERSVNAGAFVADGTLGVANPITPSVPLVSGAQTTYRYRAIIQNGTCASVTGPTATIIVNPVPPKPTITPSGATTFCLGGSVTLTSSSTLASSYRWYRNGVLTGTTTQNIVLNTIAQSGTYTVETMGVTPSNCVSPISDPISVTINPLPTASNPAGGGSVCAGSPAPDISWTLTGTAPFNVTYTDGTSTFGPIVENSTTFTIASPTTAGTYRLTALSDNNSCNASAASLTALTSATVTVGGNPPAFNTTPFLTPSEACINGASTSDPVLSFSLTTATSEAGTYTLYYRVNGSPASAPYSSKTFSVNTGTGAITSPAANLTFTEGALNSTGTHTIRIVSIVSPSGCQSIFNTDLSFIVRPLPVINTQPTAQAICSLGTASFSVVATGTSVTYQWQEQVGGVGVFNNIVDGGVYSGATTATLTLTSAPVSMSTNRYQVIVRSVFPTTFSCPVTSNAVTLTVRPFPTISTPPPNRVICQGNNTTFTHTSAVASPSTITGYQWQVSTNGGALYTDLTNTAPYSNVTTATLTITNAATGLNGNLYRVRVTGTGGCTTDSPGGTLTVNPNPTATALTPIVCADLIYVAGSPGISGTNASNVDLTQYDIAVADEPGLPVAIPANTVVRYYPTATDRTNGTNQIVAPRTITPATLTIFARVVNTSTTCFTNVNLTFTIRALPQANNFSAQVCEDIPPGTNLATVNLTNFNAAVSDVPPAPVAVPANRTIEWYTNSNLLPVNRIPAGSALGAEEKFTITANTTVFAKIIDTTPSTPGCSNIAELTLTYQKRPNDNVIRDGASAPVGTTYTVCASTSLVLLQIDQSVNPGSTYTWTVPPPSVPGEFELLTGTNNFFIILRFANAIASPGIPISVKETLGTAACDGNTFTTNVVVEGSPPKPVITGPSTVCANANGIVFSVPAVGGSTYSWSLPPGATITSLPVNSASITVQMSTFSGSVSVVQSSGNGCNSPAADAFPVTVVSRPTMTSAASNTLCSGQNVQAVHTLTSSIASTTYNWEVVSVTGFVSGAILGDAANGVTSINQTLSNTSGVTATVTYRVTPVGPTTGSSPSVNCTGNPQNVTITVTPEPVITPSQVKAVCSGSPVNYKILLTPAGLPTLTKFEWPVPAMPAGLTGGTANPTLGGEPQNNAVHIGDVLVNSTNAPLSAIYTITPTNGTCVGTPVDVEIVVNPTPAIPTQTATICSGTAFTVLPVNGGTTIVPAGTTYTWTAPTVSGGITGGSAQPVGQTTISQTLTNPTNVPQTANYTVTPVSGAGGSCAGAPFTVSVTVNPAPAIPTQNTTVCSGAAFTVSPANGGSTVVPSGTTYSWTNPSVTGGMTGGSAQSGQTNISQTLINPTNTPQTATYTVTPTSGAAGNCVGADFTISVTVNPAPDIPDQTPAAICSGTSFTVTPANGGATIVPVGTTYTWTNPGVTGGITGGSAQPVGQFFISQTLTNPTNIPQTATYTVTPRSGAAGSCVGDTFTITVTVNPAPVIPAQVATICSGGTFSVTPANGGTTIVPAGTTYTWTTPVVTGGITGGSAQAIGQTSITQALVNPTNVPQSATYTVTPTSGAAGSCVGGTFTITVTVNPTPVIADQSSTICSGGTFTVAPANGGSTIVPSGTTYSWTNPAVTGGITGGSAQSGQTNISQALTNPTNVPQTATYTVTPTSGAAGSCVGADFTVTVMVNPTPVIPAQPVTICSGTAFTVTPVNGGTTIVPAGTTYTWTAPVVTGGITGGSGQGIGVASISQTLTNPTNVPQTATYTVTPTSGAAGSCMGATFTVSVTVNPTPVIPARTATICSNGTFTITPANGGSLIVPAGTTYAWGIPVVTGGITGGSAQSGQTNISQTLINPTNVAQTATYTVTPTSGAAGACVGADFTVTVTVNPTPDIPDQTPAAICSGTSFTVTPANGGSTIVPAGTTYTWTNPVVTGGLTGGSAQSTGQFFISQTLTNPTNTPQTATYTVTPTSGAAGSCVGDTFTITVTVNPAPVIPTQTATICSGGTFTVTPVDGGTTIVPAGTTYTWTNPSVTGGITGGSAQGTGQTSISQALTNPTNTPQTATYTVTPTSGAAGSCVGATFTITVTVNPTPVIPAQAASICSEATFTIAPANSGGTIVPAGTTYTWPVPVVTGGITGASAQSGQTNISQALTNPTNVPQTATYTVTPTSGAAGSCVGADFVVTITVNPKPEITAQVATICSGTSFSVSPVDGGTTIVPAGTTYTWTAPVVTGGITGSSAQGVGVSAISQTLTNPTNTPQTATYTVTPRSGAAGNCVGDTFIVTVTVNPTPVIPTQTSTICSGGTFTIAPANAGATIVPASTTYSWGVPVVTGGITGGSAQSGQTNISQMLLNPTNTPQTATYTVTPTSGAAGACVGADFTVTVTVNPTPEIPNQTPAAICSGTSFMVTPANGGSTIVPAGTTYTWTNPAVTGGITGGSAQSTGQFFISQTLTNPTNTPQTATYTVTPTSGVAGNCVGNTFTITVTVNPTPVIPTQTSTICSGGTFTVTPANAGATIVPAGTTYTWTNPSVTGGITGGSAQGTGQTSISQALTNPTNTPQTATYTVTPTSGAAGACVGAAFTITVTVNPTPVIPAQAATICSEATFTIAPANGGGTIVPASTTYSWPIPVVTGGVTGGSAQSGQTNISQALTNPTNVPQTATYTVTPTSGAAGSCVGADFVVTITVNPKPEITAQVATICSGTSFSVSPVDGGTTIVPAGTTYTWTAPAVTGGITGGSAQGTGQTSISQTLTNPTNVPHTATYTVTPRSGAAGNCVGDTFTVTVTVNPTPVIPAQTSTICSGGTFTITPANAGVTIVPASTTYSWGAPVVTGSITGGSAQSGQPNISQTLVNPTNVPQTATYTVTPTSGAAGACVGADFTITVTVNPTPVIPNQAATVCSDEAFSITPANAGAVIVPSGTTYTWTTPLVTGGMTGGSAQATPQSSISQTLSNLSGTSQTATYTVTPVSGAAGNCTGATFTVLVTVNPEPVGQALSTIERCSGQAINFDIQNIINNVAPFTGGNSVVSKFRYTVLADFPLDAVPSVFPGTFDRVTATSLPISESFSNYSNHDVTLTYTITPISVASNCEGTPFVLKVVYHPEPVGSNFTEPNCNTALNHNIQTTQITNGLPSVFTYVITQSPAGSLTLPSDRTVPSDAPIADSYVNLTGTVVEVTYTITAYNKQYPACVGSAPFTYKVTISPKPVGITDTKAAVCSDQTFVLDPQGNISPSVPSTFTWTATYDGAAIPSGSGVITASFNNTSNVAKNAVYTITPTAQGSGCAGLPFSITVPISPEPVMDSSLANPAAVCSTNPGSTNPINVILNTNGTSINADTYIIALKSQEAGLVGTPTTGTFAAAGDGSSNAIANDTYRNTTAAQLRVVYTVTPRVGTCLGDPFDITVLINPEPVLSAPANPNVCSTNAQNSNPINVILGTNGTSVNAFSYALLQIQYSNGGPFSTTLPAGFTRIPGLGTGINLIRNEKFNNISGIPITVRYSIQATSAAGCLGDPLDYEVTIDPEPILTPNTAIICSGVPTGLILGPAAGSSAITSYELISVLPAPGSTGVSAAATNVTPGPYTAHDFLKDDIFFNITDVNQVMRYTVVPLSGLCKGIRQTIDITVNPAPALIADLDEKVCSGSQSGIVLTDNSSGNSPVSSPPFSVVATSYDIISITPDPALTGGVSSPLGITTNPNEIRDDHFDNTTNNPLNVVYRIVPISAANCRGPEKVITLTVEPLIVVNATNPANICSGQNTAIVITSPSNPTPNPNPVAGFDALITFNYFMQSAAGVSGNTSGSNIAQDPATGFTINDALVNSTNAPVTVHYKVTATAGNAADGKGCASAQIDVPVTVEPRPRINNIGPKTVCTGEAVNLNLVSPTLPTAGVIKFAVTATPENAMVTRATPDPGALLANNTVLADAWTNSDIEPRYVDYTFEARNVDGSNALICGNGVIINVRVTINPVPHVTPDVLTMEICSGTLVEIPLAVDTDPSFTIVRWTALESSTDVRGESNGAGDILFQTLSNTGNSPQTVDYTITPYYNSGKQCAGPAQHVIITVNPMPTMTNIPARTVCAGSALNVNLLTFTPTDPSRMTFRWAVTDVNGIGTPGQFDGTGTTINQTYTNNTDASATLLYEITPIYLGTGAIAGGCEGIARIMNVTVSPTITAAFISTDEGVCKGTPVFLSFELHGQAPFDFTYNEITTSGTVARNVTRTGNVRVERVTPAVTTTYEIVSVKDALGCQVTLPSPRPSVTITVYETSTANWTAVVPPFIGGNSTVTFTNTSSIIDPAMFRYEWTFGTDASPSPQTATGVGPFNVNYNRQGDHYVTLRVVNIAAEAAGQSCESSFSQRITIPILPLVAGFTAEPQRVCFPSTITVTSNTSTGDIMEWRVVDQNGRTIIQSNLALPEFLITSPGSYSIFLTTRDSFTGTVANAQQTGFEVFANPVASFDLRPNIVHVPDTKVTTFNFSTGATDYLWDFGDGGTSDLIEPEYTYKVEGQYDVTLVAMNDHGGGVICRDTLVRQVTAKQGGVTKVPNAFTPNLNGPGAGSGGGSNGTFNDVFLPIVKGAEEFNMQVFDRWGNLIFESNSSSIGWDGYNKDGKLMPAGVYVYKLTLRLSDGQRTTQIGDITMIR